MFRPLAALVLSLASAAVLAQAGTTRIRANVVSFDGGTLVVKTAVGKEIRAAVTEKTRISYPKAMKLSDIKEGDFVGSAAMPGPEGKLIAREVHVFPEAQRGTGEGHREWDLPDSTMTNAAVTKKINVSKGGELTLTYPGGSRVIVVTDATPIVTNVPGDKSLLVPGAYVVVNAQTNPDGSVTAVTINATSKDGVRPPI